MATKRFGRDFSQFGRTRPVEGGLATANRRGRFGHTMWGRAFVDALERLGDRGRMARGRAYARSGQVVSVGIDRGVVVGEVQGSQLDPFEAVVRLRPLDDDAVADVVARVRREPGSLAVLAGGTIPDSFAHLVMPSDAADFDFDCTCPDDGWPCKHAAALAYVAAERIDAEPLQLLELRGLRLDELIDAVDTSGAEADDAGDWFGADAVLPELPEPVARAAPDDLEPLLLRAALRTFCGDEREVDDVLTELGELYGEL
ncbi:hypothetical protein DW322_17430 [Rhodococcus rhodnii]|uniref:SWIM-type domain-containing protein n=2 Tax=Rhodococcus rhodnii TaxID=38312 RepID=R7WIA1_9NOCA|nr:SWIM zinc finger family protein [Rhodococcus rhodnii]EOM74911.1 hypothetical protein Rrhod_3788 [Rhodococcus rhodnii LMG 5362]TXG91648.1 hypothetical protein DW322_17430 [Rhodococcus rhodnii]